MCKRSAKAERIFSLDETVYKPTLILASWVGRPKSNGFGITVGYDYRTKDHVRCPVTVIGLCNPSTDVPSQPMDSLGQRPVWVLAEYLWEAYRTKIYLHSRLLAEDLSLEQLQGLVTQLPVKRRRAMDLTEDSVADGWVEMMAYLAVNPLTEGPSPAILRPG